MPKLLVKFFETKIATPLLNNFFKLISENFYLLKSTSVKKGYIKSEKTPKFGVGSIFKTDFVIPT